MILNQFQRFSASDRTHILEDAFSLANAAELDYKIALEMTNYLSNEFHSVPWDMAATKFLSINTLLTSTNASIKFKVNFEVTTILIQNYISCFQFLTLIYE